MNFLSFSEDGDYSLQKTLENICKIDTIEFFQLQRKIDLCPYSILFIGMKPFREPVFLDRNRETQGAIDVQKAWICLNLDSSNNPSSVQKAQDTISKYGVRLSERNDNFWVQLYLAHKDYRKSSFFYLVRKEDRLGISPLVLRSVCIFWQIATGHIPLHASGIVHNGRMYLFSGPSGSGKSTISELSAKKRDIVLDHDQVMIYRKSGRGYSANAWGYNLDSSEVTIQAFFRLIQDETDRLIPLTKLQTIKYIWEQSLEITGSMLPDEEFGELFTQVIEFADIVPGFELHFRKSPDFWKLIDTEFGLV